MADVLWNIADLVAAAGGTADGQPTGDVTGISIDTRSLKPGELFVALKDQRDGHEFVPSAFQRGASAALVGTAYQRQGGDGLLVRVDDPLRALERLAIAARARLHPEARVVAVTGSAGKTTTKEMLRAAFEATAHGHVHASVKSFNNHWGVPLTLASMPSATRFAVFEIGMNHAGEISPLVRLVRPHVALVTTVAPAHLGNFASIEEIADAKAEIFDGLGLTGDGVTYAVLPRDSEHFARLLSRASKVTGIAAGEGGDFYGLISFGTSEGADCRLKVADSRFGPDATEAAIDVGVARKTRFGVGGRHNAVNALGAIATWMAATAGLDLAGEPGEEVPGLQRVLGALERLKLDPAGRGQTYGLDGPLAGVTLVDESYNANPASMRAALETLALFPRDRHPRRIAVLGDMLELGAGAAGLHADLADAITSAGIDKLYACGANMRHLYDALPPERRGAWAETASALEQALRDGIAPGDVVMVKGSNGSRMGPLVEMLRTLGSRAA